MAVVLFLTVALVVQATFAHPLTLYKNSGLPVLNVVCPGSTKECPDGDTCCSRGSDNFGCCPKLHAVCCDDKKHCCPQGYTCDKGDGECLKAGSTHPLLSLSDMASSPEIVCPDGKEKEMCPSGDTCCLLKGGTYGCCPSPNAVCCADMIHCCPNGLKCDNATGKCEGGAMTHPLMELARQEKQEVGKQNVGNIVCPDKSDTCPDGDTCCPIGDNKQGCCPHDNAVCCPDHKHCCPEGFSCGSVGKACKRGAVNHPLVELLRPQDIVCPDKMHECPNGETCCQVEGGSYGCCPKPNAVCCSDKKHCCPEGTTCESGACKQGLSYHPLIELASRPEKPQVGKFVCPGRTSMCPDGDTCCPIGGGKDGCCPKEHGVCCPDKDHCCPEGHTCSTKGDGKCLQGDSSHPMLKLYAPQDHPGVKMTSSQDLPPVIVCPNSVDKCSLGSTCCMQDSGRYACCPKEDAVCCNHGNYCCAKGYTCNDKDGLCDSLDGQDKVPFLN